MKHILSYLSLALVIMCAMLQGCTRNDGDIGPLFGIWKLTEMRVGGTPESIDGGTVFWAFQSSTVRMTLTRPYHDRDDVFGSWRMADNTLFLDFPDEQYAPLPATRLPRQAALQVLRLTGSRLTLMYTTDAPEATEIIYEFQKW